MFRRPKSIDGMTEQRRTKSDGAEVLDAKVLPWKPDSVAEAAEQKVARAKTDSEARQNRIIDFFRADEKVEVTPEEIVGMDTPALRELKRRRANDLRRQTLQGDAPKVTPGQREDFLQRLAHGEITSKDEHNFLLLIPNPLQDQAVDAPRIFERIVADPRARQILAVAAGKNAGNWQDLDPTAVTMLLTAVQEDGDDYRTPVGFIKLRRHFLKGIHPRSSEQIYQGYVRSMNDLEQQLYGERLDYFRDFELLRHEARKYADTKPAVWAKPQEVQLEPLSDERSAEILGRAVIEGDAWIGGGIERSLSVHHLTLAKLVPRFAVRMDDAEIGLSDCFQVSPGRIAVIAYVPTAVGVKVRTFYQNGMDLWRYLPDYTRRADGKIDFYCIGYSSESVTLPVVLQEALARLVARKGVRVLTGAYDPEFLAAGTAYAYDTRQDYQMQWSYGRMRGDYYQEVSADPVNHDFDNNSSNHRKAPYTLSVDYNSSPDFDHPIVSFELELPELGKVKVDGFASNDEQYRWLFCRDSKDRVWIGDVEVMSPLTATGLRRDWAIMGDLMTPLYEPTSQAGIYGDRNDTKGARQCMWNNYLSNIPLIQEYLRKVAK